MLLRVVRAKIIWMGGSFLVSAGNYGHSTKLLDPHRRDRRQLIYIYVAGKLIIILGCWTRFHNVSLDRNYAQGLSLGMEERAMIMAGPETRPLMARCVRGCAKSNLNNHYLEVACATKCISKIFSCFIIISTCCTKPTIIHHGNHYFILRLQQHGLFLSGEYQVS